MDVHSGSIIYFPMTVQFIFREQILQIFALGSGEDLKFKKKYIWVCMHDYTIPGYPHFPYFCEHFMWVFFWHKTKQKTILVWVAPYMHSLQGSNDEA